MFYPYIFTFPVSSTQVIGSPIFRKGRMVRQVWHKEALGLYQCNKGKINCRTVLSIKSLPSFYEFFWPELQSFKPKLFLSSFIVDLARLKPKLNVPCVPKDQNFIFFILFTALRKNQDFILFLINSPGITKYTAQVSYLSLWHSPKIISLPDVIAKCLNLITFIHISCYFIQTLICGF